MMRIVLGIFCLLFALACGDGGTGTESGEGTETGAAKGDHGDMTDQEWANQFFISQIYDTHWNPNGSVSDLGSNSCGPASLAMVMRERGLMPEDLGAQEAIDHARALMYPTYPEIDEDQLPEGALLYEQGEYTFVADDDHSVFFDLMDEDASVPQGIAHAGAEPTFGYSWSELDEILGSGAAVIAYGHITEDWRARFSGEYGDFEDGAVPHFLALFAASNGDEYIVCDPMHLGGAMVMVRTELQTFFKSPVSEFDTSLRFIGWSETSESEQEEQAEFDANF